MRIAPMLRFMSAHAPRSKGSRRPRRSGPSWPSAHEFFAVVTHARIYRTPTPAETALAQLGALAALDNIAFIGETDDHLLHLEPMALAAKVRGGMIHDARIAAICLSQGVTELWSADRDFSRFPGLKVRNPLVEPDS